jgi:hypothetical protein
LTENFRECLTESKAFDDDELSIGSDKMAYERWLEVSGSERDRR